MVHPTVPADVEQWLTVHDPEALETLQAIGVPPRQHTMRPRQELELTEAFADRTVESDGRRVGTACLVGVNALAMREPYRDDWLIAEDGSFVHASCGAYGDAIHPVSTSFTTFVVLTTALRRAMTDDRVSVVAQLRRLVPVDPWAVSSIDSPWVEDFADRHGVGPTMDDVDRLRAAAFGYVVERRGHLWDLPDTLPDA